MKIENTSVCEFNIHTCAYCFSVYTIVIFNMHMAVLGICVCFCGGMRKMVALKRGGVRYAAPRCSSWGGAPISVTIPA